MQIPDRFQNGHEPFCVTDRPTDIGPIAAPQESGKEFVMSKKTIAAVLTALTLVTTRAASGQAQAKSWGTGLGIGLAAGALVGAAAVGGGYGYYGAPAYVVEPAYGCRRVVRYDAWGNARVIRVCDVY